MRCFSFSTDLVVKERGEKLSVFFLDRIDSNVHTQIYIIVDMSSINFEIHSLHSTKQNDQEKTIRIFKQNAIQKPSKKRKQSVNI